MNREQRIQMLDARYEDSDPEVFNLSEEAFRQAQEQIEQSSESRFETARSSELITSMIKATKSFSTEHGLSVVLTDSADGIPNVPANCYFKYSGPHDTGDLPTCLRRIRDGEKITSALVCEDGLLIGYGIAVTRGMNSKIEIIDVDCYSRRESGFMGIVEFGEDAFQVGVGHVVVVALMEVCPRPVSVDATNPQSRYIFKSLGFIHDADLSNPCILRLE